MYLSRWGLSESPFGPAGTFFYEGIAHEEALARLHFLVDQRRRVGLLLGEAGVGKSLLLDVLARQLRYDGCAVLRANLLGVDPHELLWQLAIQAGSNQRADTSNFALWRSVADQLVENRYQQRATVLLLDDADEASPEVLQQVSKLALVDQSPEARITIVLASKQRRVGELGRRLLELAELRIDLDPWDISELRGYLKAALAKAGCRSALFSDQAIARLYQLSSGIPRRVKQLADLALVAAASCELDEIDLDTVDGVFQELGVVTAGSR